jgi:hypothetical protein
MDPFPLSFLPLPSRKLPHNQNQGPSQTAALPPLPPPSSSTCIQLTAAVAFPFLSHSLTHIKENSCAHNPIRPSAGSSHFLPSFSLWSFGFCGDKKRGGEREGDVSESITTTITTAAAAAAAAATLYFSPSPPSSLFLTPLPSLPSPPTQRSTHRTIPVHHRRGRCARP